VGLLPLVLLLLTLLVSFSFSFIIKEVCQKLTPSIFMEPPDIGSITFSGTTYINGQSGEYVAGTYQIEANVPKGYIFYNWIATGRFSVANSEPQQTNVIVI
jgi:hypothetical protein